MVILVASISKAGITRTKKEVNMENPDTNILSCPVVGEAEDMAAWLDSDYLADFNEVPRRELAALVPITERREFAQEATWTA